MWSLRLVCVLAAATVAGSAGAAPGGPVVVPRVPSAAGAPALVPAAPDPLDRSLAPDPLDPRDGPSTAPPSDVPLPGLGPHLARALRTAPLAPVRALARGLAPATYAALGAEVEATIGPIAALRLPGRAVAERLARAGAVLERPGLLRLQLDHSREVVGADAADFADGYAEPLRGAGVMIGTYDSGIDHRHPDVRRLDGTSRVHVVWDQDAGQTCSRTVLDLGACPLGDDAGHGTHVASIALGSGPRYRGMAPDATLIAVESLLFEQLVPALAFMRSQAAAAGRPLVVNISLGGHVGAHDGTSLDAQAIDAFEHLVVVAAGNEGAAAVHAGAELDEARPVDVPLRVGGGETTAHHVVLDVWGAPTASITASLVLVRSGRVVWASTRMGVGMPGRTEEITEGDTSRGKVALDAEATLSPLNGRPHVALELEVPELEGAVLALRLEGRGRVDAWIDAPADEPVAPRFSASPILGLATERVGDAVHSLSDLASAARALAVSAQISRTQVVLDGQPAVEIDGEEGRLARFSSYGPTLDPARTGDKPDLAAPGQLIVAASSRDARPGGGLYRILSGTSMAVPHVAGAAALLLGARPTATRDELRLWLVGGAAAAPDDDPRWGRGALDVAGALERAGVTQDDCGCQTARPSGPGLALITAALALARRARRRPRP